MEVSGQLYVMVLLLPQKEPSVFIKRSGGLQSRPRSGGEEK
jgi:hypothetical protein